MHAWVHLREYVCVTTNAVGKCLLPALQGDMVHSMFMYIHDVISEINGDFKCTGKILGKKCKGCEQACISLKQLGKVTACNWPKLPL